MSAPNTTRRFLAFATAFALSAAAHANDFYTRPTWEMVDSEVAFNRLNEHLAATGVAPDRQAKIHELWRAEVDKEPPDLLTGLAVALAEIDPQVAELVEFCNGVSSPGSLPEFAWLADSATQPLVRHNMRLYLARWLVQEGYYDEALSWTDGLAVGDVISPESLLFYRAVAQHRLVQSNEADNTLARLLERETDLPLRYQKLADLMQQDLVGLEEESLNHIARRMEDVRRRLAQGRTGKRVQGIENDVIESLDKLIKDAEDEMQRQQQARASSSPGGQQSGTPMPDSQLPEMKAPGSVERRDIGRGAGWGNLADKDREKALQEIGREFPSHYREVIEEYFRRLAAEDDAEQP